MIDDLTFEVWLNKSQMLLQTDNGHKSLPIFKRNTVFFNHMFKLSDNWLMKPWEKDFCMQAWQRQERK